MHHYRLFPVAAAALALLCSPPSARAAMVFGGGSRTTDCAVAFDVPGANKPAPPKLPKQIDCVDGDPACDDDETRNGECVFPVRICINSSELTGCEPDSVDDIFVDHAIDDGNDPRFDVDFQALQQRVNFLGLPNGSETCANASNITVRLRGPDGNGVMKKNKKTLAVTSYGFITAGRITDSDKVKLTCRPEGDAIYDPRDLYDGTFDRVATQVFTQSCALAGCHDSESSAGDLILLPGAAYGNLVGVEPSNIPARNDGLLLVTPGDPDMSLLYRKLSSGLPPAYGSSMPAEGSDVEPELVEIIRLWILGDGVLGQAPATGWVEGTDQ